MKEFSKVTASELDPEFGLDEYYGVAGRAYWDPEFVEFAKNYVSEYNEDEFDLEESQKKVAELLEDLYFREAAKRAGKFKTAFGPRLQTT